jgi:plasmid stability protein
MGSLTVHDLDDAIISSLHNRAAEHGWSPEAEHRAILRAALLPAWPAPMDREEAIRRLREFRERTASPDSQSAVELLREVRNARLEQLTGFNDVL